MKDHETEAQLAQREKDVVWHPFLEENKKHFEGRELATN